MAEFAELNPQRARAIWPDHPAVETTQAMVQIANSAREGKPTDAATFRMLNDAAVKSPLLPEPFLVRGIQARLDGDEGLAGRAFQAAELRDGRSVPARYFLADHYLRTGQLAIALREIAMLARMVPSGTAALAPYVARFATDPHNWPQLRVLFRSEPTLEDETLSALAADPRNSDIVLELAKDHGSSAKSPWLLPLLSGLVKAGDYAKAYEIWHSVAKVRTVPGALIYDAAFKDAVAPGPFNWTLTSNALGLAERQPHGRLHVLYFGEEYGGLAWQLLLLKPGRYRLSMQISGDVGKPGSLGWRLRCEDSRNELFAVDLTARVQQSFVVPSGCPAQRLELAGVAPELPRSFDVTISGLSLSRDRPGG